MKNNVIRHGSRTYEVKKRKINNIHFRVSEQYTTVSVHYKGTRYYDFAFNIRNKNKKIDIDLFDKVHTSITKLNKKLLEEKQCS